LGNEQETGMIKRYNNLSLLLFIPGLVLQVAGCVLIGDHNQAEAVGAVPIAVLACGTLLAILGFSYYAMAKGRSRAWGFAAFLGMLGVLLLSTLKDRSGDPWNT